MRNCVWALVLALFVAPATMAKPPQQEKQACISARLGVRLRFSRRPVSGCSNARPGCCSRPDDGTLRRLPGSTFSFTLTQIRDGYGPADWYPGDHPQMPEIVAHGKKPEVRACSSLPLPERQGPSRERGDRRPPL